VTIVVEVYSFLRALPALLALAGFVLYHVLAVNKSGDEISRRIVDKLRTAAPSEFTPDQRLAAKQVERILEHRQQLKELVGEQDFRLLKQALTQQFVITIVVYVLTLGFCAWSVYLFVQPPFSSPSVTSPTVQNSFGDRSPNVISSGAGSVNIQNGSPANQPSARAEKKKR
jgi:hypothetical protein